MRGMGPTFEEAVENFCVAWSDFVAALWGALARFRKTSR